jgi:hypothetical protein
MSVPILVAVAVAVLVAVAVGMSVPMLVAVAVVMSVLMLVAVAVFVVMTVAVLMRVPVVMRVRGVMTVSVVMRVLVLMRVLVGMHHAILMGVGMFVVVLVPMRGRRATVVMVVVCHEEETPVPEARQVLSGSSTTRAPSWTSTLTVGWSSQTPGEVSFLPVSMSKPTSWHGQTTMLSSMRPPDSRQPAWLHQSSRPL